MSFLTGFGIGMGVLLVLVIAFYVLLVIADWKIFTKAGEPGWKSLIPIYNMYILFKITWNTKMFWLTLIFTVAASILNGQEGFLMYLGGAFAVVALVITYMDMLKLSKSFGHGVGYMIGLIFLPNIFTMILGFGSDKYLGPQE